MIAAGVVCVGVGAVGIVVPVLPTTPFLLLAVACFVRSSPRMHRWLLTHPRLGPYVEGFVDRKGIPRHVKRTTLLVIWPVMGLSIFLVARRSGPMGVKVAVAVVLLGIAAAVTRFVLRQPTRGDMAGTDQPVE